MSAPLPPWGGRFVTPIPTVSTAVAGAVATPSTCVPEGAVLLTLFNDHHRPLYELQFRRVRQLECLISRLVSICFGADACRDAIGRAVSGGDVRASDFRKGAYVELTWAKWRLMHAALEHARAVLFVDSDVVLFRNPFTAMGAVDVRAHDIRFLAELACAPTATCASQPAWRAPVRLPGAAPWPCSLNGGVLLLTSQRLAARVAEREPVFDYRHKNSSGLPIDQDPADEIANRRGHAGGDFSSCALPTSFVGFCWWAWGYNKGNRTLFDQLRPCELAAFHAHCLVSVAQKVTAIERMLSKTAHCSDGTSSSAAGGDGAADERLGKWGPRAPPGAENPKHAKQHGEGRRGRRGNAG